MNKKELIFFLSFVISITILLFYLGTSVAGNAVKITGSTIAMTKTDFPKGEIIFYFIVTMLIIIIGIYYLAKRKRV